MATITVRNLDDEIKAQLRVVAARNGHSMEEQVRVILRSALQTGATEQAGGLGSRIRAHFAPDAGVDLELPERRDPPRAADLPTSDAAV